MVRSIWMDYEMEGRGAMKLFVFFGLIGLVLFVTIFFSLRGKKNSPKKGTIFFLKCL